MTELLTMREVADYLRTPVETVRYWRHVDKGPESFKIGRRVMYDRDVVDRWLDVQRAASEAAPDAAHRPTTVCSECGEPWPCSEVRDETFCKATTSKGSPCTRRGHDYYGGFCGAHRHLEEW